MHTGGGDLKDEGQEINKVKAICFNTVSYFEPASKLVIEPCGEVVGALVRWVGVEERAGEEVIRIGEMSLTL